MKNIFWRGLIIYLLIFLCYVCSSSPPLILPPPFIGLNGKLEYTISGGDEKDQFAISSNGTISTKAPLDREDQSFYNLVVRASDMAMPPHARLSSTVQVSEVCPRTPSLLPSFLPATWLSLWLVVCKMGRVPHGLPVIFFLVFVFISKG